MKKVPSIPTDQMREVDRLMIEEFGIVLLQMMENAGRNLARLAAMQMEGPSSRNVLVLAGRGNNGGGGMVAARHLTNMGYRVSVILTSLSGALTGIPADQASILHRMGVEVLETDAMSVDDAGQRFADGDVIIDALIGYSLAGAPRDQAAELIGLANRSGRPIVALDVPSGVDAGSGEVFEPAIKATATLTLALPKTGLGLPGVRERLGQLYLADISVPAALYHEIGLVFEPPFAKDSLVHLAWNGAGWAWEGA